MNNFIKLMRRGKRRATAKNMSPIWIQIDHIISIHENPYGGSFIVLRANDFWLGATTGIYVTADARKLNWLICRKLPLSTAFLKQCIQNFIDNAMPSVCDKLCRYPREYSDQEKLDTMCDHCPLREQLTNLMFLSDFMDKARGNVNE